MEQARRIFSGEENGVSACWYCAGIHARVANLPAQFQPCPRIKRIEWAANGESVASVEFWPSGQWESLVVFPGDAWDNEGEM